ncbi:hypothetical protein GDO86_006278 [Hymenochirus boettgeri]|uniref:Uncharacterized protein n=1 Tax=Hymenochirus boettgeri TaxID=247094 RepID=A0A8T2JAX4_9PIPI|nr:hypothetical protein GDO86_006278 [Hymenochirus boettgeri]
MENSKIGIEMRKESLYRASDMPRDHEEQTNILQPKSLFLRTYFLKQVNVFVSAHVVDIQAFIGSSV